jgi:hypothetical protein
MDAERASVVLGGSMWAGMLGVVRQAPGPSSHHPSTDPQGTPSDRRRHRSIFPWYQLQSLARRVVHFSRWRSCRREAVRDANVYRRYGLGNLTVCVAGWWEAKPPELAALCFHTLTRAERNWPASWCKALQLIAQIF